MTDIREEVSKAYSDAIRRNQDKKKGATSSGCCSGALPRKPEVTHVPSCCGGSATAKGEPVAVAAQTAGYTEEAERYGDAADSSFGCGNPLAFAGVTEGQTVVDLGSGAGLDLLIAADKVGKSGQVIGIDMTDDMIEVAQKNIAKSGHENIEIRKGFIESLPVEDGSVDWVISNCVINLSPDKPKVFQEIARVLKPGGQFSISDIVVKELPDWIREQAAAYAACVAGAVSEEEYLAGLEAAGLEGIKVTERLVYEADQIRAMIDNDLASFGIDPKVVDVGLAQVEGNVWSAKVVGRKPA